MEINNNHDISSWDWNIDPDPVEILSEDFELFIATLDDDTLTIHSTLGEPINDIPFSE